MWEKTFNLLDGEKKFLHSVGRKGLYIFLAFLVYKIVNVFIVNDPTVWEIVNFFIEIVGSYLAVMYAVDKPGVARLLKTVRLALQDGKITRDEAMAIMRETFFFLIGVWADQGVLNNLAKKEEEKTDELDAI